MFSMSKPVVHNGTKDEGGPLEAGNLVLISSHRKLLRSKAVVLRRGKIGTMIPPGKLDRVSTDVGIAVQHYINYFVCSRSININTESEHRFSGFGPHTGHYPA
jgi:hypothetical protein